MLIDSAMVARLAVFLHGPNAASDQQHLSHAADALFAALHDDTPPADAIADQRLLALALANRTRSQRKKLRDDIGQLDMIAGMRQIIELVLSPPDCLRPRPSSRNHEPTGIPISKLLLWPRNVGEARVRTIQRRAGLPAHARVGAITSRQAERLVEAIDQEIATSRAARAASPSSYQAAGR